MRTHKKQRLEREVPVSPSARGIKSREMKVDGSRHKKERKKLLGSISIMERQLRVARDASECNMCRAPFANNRERDVAYRAMSQKLEFLRTKERKLQSAMAGLEKTAPPAAVSLLGPSMTLTQLSDQPKDQPLYRIGYVNFFRSLRSQGIMCKSCPICCKEISDMASFLSSLDRSSYLAGNRFFDDCSDDEEAPVEPTSSALSVGLTLTQAQWQPNLTLRSPTRLGTSDLRATTVPTTVNLTIRL